MVLLLPLVAVTVTYVGAHEACDAVKRQLRLARYRRQWRLRTRPLDGGVR